MVSVYCLPFPAHLVHKLQLVSAPCQAIGVDVATGYRSGVQDHVPGHAHQHVPVISPIREATDGHTTTGQGGGGGVEVGLNKE